jgi:cbb3-type cytochrome oxidase maturation protein|tara:strand:+ start:707 stop:883 length:177 start_codon:yes stop_codon:yes gene_type:complete
MESLAILVPIALVFTGIAIAAFLWAVRSDQYEDLDKSASSILFDEDTTTPDKVTNPDE